MDNAKLAILGLLATRNSSIDLLTSSIGENGANKGNLEELADKWALESWTEFDKGNAEEDLGKLVSAEYAKFENDIFTITDKGRSVQVDKIKEYLKNPKRLSQFTLGVAFQGLFKKEDYHSYIKEFQKNLSEAIAGNKKKLEGLRSSPFEDVVSLCLAQMEATKAWLDQKLKKV